VVVAVPVVAALAALVIVTARERSIDARHAYEPAQLAAIDRDVAADFRALDGVEGGRGRARVLRPLYAEYRELVGLELERIETRGIEWAGRLDQRFVDPAFVRLRRATDRIEADANEEAAAARHVTGIWTYGSLGVGALLLVGLATLAERLRREAAASRERELERVAAEREHDSLHDPLTGLPNRRLFQQRIREAVAGGRFALLLLDLDGFKELNDTLGHAAGDRLLAQVGPCVARTVGDRGLVARLGGDEFAVLLPGGTADGAASAAEFVRAAIAQPFAYDGVALHVEASIGIARFPADATDPDTLMQRADIAMYQAKRGRTGAAHYDAARDPHSTARLALLGDLAGALDGEQLVLHYQPKIELRTGRVVGVEALVRWQHPTRGLLPPGSFLPLAEQTSVVRPLTLAVLDLALAQCAAWRPRASSCPWRST